MGVGGGYSPAYDYSVNKPAGTDDISLGDDRIRANQMHRANAYAVEHYDPSGATDASEDDYGRHNFVTLKEQTSKPDLTGSTSRHGFYAKSDGIYFEKSDGTELQVMSFTTDKIPGSSVSSGVDIPSGTKLLFYSDTAISGYSIVTDYDDQLVYIGKGSAAGGLPGGAARSGSTWTLNFGGHTHTVAAHQHHTNTSRPNDDGGTVWSMEVDWGTEDVTAGCRYKDFDASSGTETHTCVYTKENTAQTSSSTSISTSSWRPAGHVFTLQERE